MHSELFDADFMQKLEYLALVSRKLFRGVSRGEHRTYRKGSSLEFQDHRPYQAGDDFRYIDWSAFKRMGRPFVKLFAAEEDLTVHILVDTSASMASGRPPKLAYAGKVGAALAYIALMNLDRVQAAAFAGGLGRSLPPTRRRSVVSLFDYFGSLEAAGHTDLNAALASYAATVKRPGLAVLVSDLLDPAGYADGVERLLYAGFDIMVLHILDDDEIDPPQRGILKLRDCETAEEVAVTVDSAVREAYQTTLREFLHDVERFCVDRGIEYVRSTTSIPFEELILRYLRQGFYLH